MSLQPAAAVAIIRIREPHESFLLLRRAAHPLDPWSGHFSFPGGRKEKTDTSLLDTCMRETFEEAGIQLSPENVQATLPPAYAGSRVNASILVQPYVFHLATRPSLSLNPQEIQSSCWLNASLFQQPELHVEAEVLPQHFFPAFPLDDYYVWGFTYKLLKYILEM